jgi:hypothetical protein
MSAPTLEELHEAAEQRVQAVLAEYRRRNESGRQALTNYFVEFSSRARMTKEVRAIYRDLLEGMAAIDEGRA